MNKDFKSAFTATGPSPDVHSAIDERRRRRCCGFHELNQTLTEENESDGDKTTSAPSASQIASSRSQIICDLTVGEIRESVAVVSSVRQRVCNDQVAESRAALSVGGSAAPWSARPACGYNPASKIAGPLYGHGRPPRPGDLVESRPGVRGCKRIQQRLLYEQLPQPFGILVAIGRRHIRNTEVFGSAHGGFNDADHSLCLAQCP